MSSPSSDPFLKIWPKRFITFTAVLQLIVFIFLFLTELGNIGANFWTRNVFAGGWCGLIVLIHSVTLFCSGCCSPSRKSATNALIVTLFGLIATAALISFDTAFLLRPDSCILTPSCWDNSKSNTTFSYAFQQSFFYVFQQIDYFKSYSESQSKTLFQAVQVGVGSLSFIIFLVYLIIYFVHTRNAKEKVAPTSSSRVSDISSQPIPTPYMPQYPPPYVNPGAPAPYYQPGPPQAPMYPPGPPQAPMYPPGPPLPPPPPPAPVAVPVVSGGWYPQAPPQPVPRPQRVPQPPPGQIPWNGGYARY